MATNAVTFTSLDPTADKRENNTQLVTTGLWSGGVGILTNMYTSSTDVASFGTYYINVYQANPTGSEAEVQFSIAYGNFGNSGSSGDPYLKQTKAVYSQYAGQILAQGDSTFTVNGVDKHACVFLNIQRNRFKEKVNRGAWQLNFSGSSGKLSLIDNSSVSGSEMVGEGGKAYSIVSGSYNTSTGVTTISGSNPVYYGLFYPDIGMFVLDAVAVSQSGAVTGLGGTFVTAPPASNLINGCFYSSLDLGSFVARSEENVKNSIYFVRVKNREYNATTNPTYYDSAGNINPNFISEPKSYITTVGLYNDSDQLIAVAKLSSPLLKTQDRELLLKCKLDF